MRRLAVVSIAVTIIGLAAACPPARADDPAFLAVSAGGFDVNDNETAGEFRIEYRSDRKYFFLKPMIGAMLNTDGGVYGYGGINLDIFLGRRWVVMPNFAIGGYRRGSSKDLGSVMEFRSGLEIAYRFDDRSRLGVAFQHISNASIDDNNPGTESVVLTYSIPLGATTR